MNRRQTLAAVGAASLAGATSAQTAPAPPMVVFVDPRYAASRRHAEAWNGALVVPTAPDVAASWRTLPADRPLRIAGLTTYADFTVILGEARARGLKLQAHAIEAHPTATLHAWRLG
jgi:hypothetical protein